LPSRTILIVASVLGTKRAVIVLSVLNVAGDELTLTNTSPIANDSAAGPYGSSAVISARPESLTCSAVASSGVSS